MGEEVFDDDSDGGVLVRATTLSLIFVNIDAFGECKLLKVIEGTPLEPEIVDDGGILPLGFIPSPICQLGLYNRFISGRSKYSILSLQLAVSTYKLKSLQCQLL
jgi:hypothetical protein